MNFSINKMLICNPNTTKIIKNKIKMIILIIIINMMTRITIKKESNLKSQAQTHL